MAFAYEIVESVTDSGGRSYGRVVARVGPFQTQIAAAAGLRQCLARWPGARLSGKTYRLVSDDRSTPAPTMAPADGMRFRPSPLASRQVRVR
jgi:hypothetical protein